jgi:hypothetical protein
MLAVKLRIAKCAGMYLSEFPEFECRLTYGTAPAFEAVEYHEEDYKGIFHQASAYRGKPTPELDERWRKLCVRVRWVNHKCKVNSDEFDREATLCSWWVYICLVVLSSRAFQ